MWNVSNTKMHHLLTDCAVHTKLTCFTSKAKQDSSNTLLSKPEYITIKTTTTTLLQWAIFNKQQCFCKSMRQKKWLYCIYSSSTRWNLENPNGHFSSLRAWNKKQPQFEFARDHLVVTNMHFIIYISLRSNLIAFIWSTTCSLNKALWHHCLTVMGLFP